MISIKKISMVRNSFRQLASMRETIFISVYKKLAESSLEFDGQYDADLPQRARILDGVIELALLSLDHPSALFGTLHSLGREYAGYGTWRDSHDLLAELIIIGFAEQLGESWTQEHSEAWREVLQFIVTGMLEGANTIRVA